MAILRTTRRIEFGDTDMAGIVHFANFFRFMEAAECEFLRLRGLSVKMMWEGQQLGFPRVAASCDYVQPVRFEDIIDIAVTLERLGAKSATYLFAFSHEGAAVARGKVVSVCCQVGKDQAIESVEIPATLRERLLMDVEPR